LARRRSVEELHRLHELKEKGALTEDEYAKLKARLVDADG